MTVTNPVENELSNLLRRIPNLRPVQNDILETYNLMCSCFSSKGKLLVCGNGGSSADADHIVGELMKGFLEQRPLPEDVARKIDREEGHMEYGGMNRLSKRLQCGLPAVNLCAHSALLTAVINDMGGELIFAQQVIALGMAGDVLLSLSTSGNAVDVVAAIKVAKASGLKTVGMTGCGGGQVKELCDVCICVPSDATHLVQEMHLPVYHTLCAMLEKKFFIM